MATQFQLAHSDWVKGVGVIAGGRTSVHKVI